MKKVSLLSFLILNSLASNNIQAISLKKALWGGSTLVSAYPTIASACTTGVILSSEIKEVIEKGLNSDSFGASPLFLGVTALSVLLTKYCFKKFKQA